MSAHNICIWMTGLPSSGKSTIAEKIKEEYPEFVLLDGDVIRKGLCSDLGFIGYERRENLRRLREVVKLFNQNGKSVITAFISPYEEDRLKAVNEIWRKSIPDGLHNVTEKAIKSGR